MPKSDSRGALRAEVEHRIRTGSCVYCRAPAAPDRPLTREHVIPRARGGRRKDHRIIVPACERCNSRRGCREVVLFLLEKPRRLSAFLDYLSTLPPDSIRQLDVRIFAELYAALWLLGESARGGERWRQQLRHLSAGRRLHRRRYAARRLVSAVGVRIGRERERASSSLACTAEAPTCPVPHPQPDAPSALAPILARARAALSGTLAILWGVSAERVEDAMEREHERLAARSARAAAAAAEEGVEEREGDVVSLDGWKRRRARARRPRVDRRRGRGARYGRGRAA